MLNIPTWNRTILISNSPRAGVLPACLGDGVIPGKVVSYTFAAQNDKGKLHLARTVGVDFIFLDRKYYAALRRYFQEIKTIDDQQVVLDHSDARAEN